MNKSSLMLCSLALCLPLSATADGLDLKKELNGLDIEARMVGPGEGGSAGNTATRTTQMLQLRNNSDARVTCELRPGAAENQNDASSPVTIEPGGEATMPVPGKYTDAPLQATLHCKQQ